MEVAPVLKSFDAPCPQRRANESLGRLRSRTQSGDPTPAAGPERSVGREDDVLETEMAEGDQDAGLGLGHPDLPELLGPALLDGESLDQDPAGSDRLDEV